MTSAPDLRDELLAYLRSERDRIVTRIERLSAGDIDFVERQDALHGGASPDADDEGLVALYHRLGELGAILHQVTLATGMDAFSSPLANTMIGLIADGPAASAPSPVPAGAQDAVPAALPAAPLPALERIARAA